MIIINFVRLSVTKRDFPIIGQIKYYEEVWLPLNLWESIKDKFPKKIYVDTVITAFTRKAKIRVHKYEIDKNGFSAMSDLMFDSFVGQTLFKTENHYLKDLIVMIFDLNGLNIEDINGGCVNVY